MLVKEAAKLAAQEVLKEHWDGTTFPIDPFEIADKLGMKVIVGSLRPELSGAIIAQPGDITILVEESDNFGRQTFTCAHELGHYFERKQAGDDEYSFVEVRLPGNYDLHEFYADEFAGNLLMPEAAFRADIKTHGSDYLAAAKFGVNPAAVRMRRKRLGI